MGGVTKGCVVTVVAGVVVGSGTHASSIGGKSSGTASYWSRGSATSGAEGVVIMSGISAATVGGLPSSSGSSPLYPDPVYHEW